MRNASAGRIIGIWCKLDILHREDRTYRRPPDERPHTMTDSSRRDFFKHSISFGAAALAAGSLNNLAWGAEKPGSKMKYGLVTYMWGADWDLPTLIGNLQKAKVLGVELRTTHAHGVERDLNAQQRKQVKKRFDDSPVTLVGLGSNERFDDPDPKVVQRAIRATKEFIKLSHDVGASGVKVKPNSFHKGVSHEKTIEQIGKSLNIVGAFGADYGQQIRLETHGSCSPPPIMKQIMDVADHRNVAICWNSNAPDLKGPRNTKEENLQYNFNLLADRLGATTHVRTLDWPDYPFQVLIDLMVKMDYAGWLMLEAGGAPKDRVKALAEQGELFKKMVAKSQLAL